MATGKKQEKTEFCAEKFCTANLGTEGAKSIYCDICDKYCMKCMGIKSKAHFDFVASSEHIKMVCTKCLNFTFTKLCQKEESDSAIARKVNKLESDLINLGNRIEESIKEKLDKLPKKLEEKLDDIPKELNKSYAKVTARNNSQDTELSVIIKDAITENKHIQDKEQEREKSVVISSIEESEIKEYDERLEAETAKVTTLIEEGVKIKMPKIEKILRLGAYNENRKTPRLIKVVFSDKYERDRLLRNVQNLRQADKMYERCYIRRDMSREEQTAFFSQMKIAKELNEKAENKDKFFIVKGTPKEWKIEERVRRTK